MTMKIFISWSGPKSHHVAKALRNWLPDVIQSLRPWLSSADIPRGGRWGLELARELDGTKAGVICLTKHNQKSPWLLFEAGALGKALEHTLVGTYLIGMKNTDLEEGPLTQFQASVADKENTFELLSSINRALESESLAEAQLRR